MALNGIDPIIIFRLFKQVPVKSVANIPISSDSTTKRVMFAVVPIYLSEQITGVYIDSESKSLDIETDVQALTSGTGANVTQKAIASITNVNLIAKQGSIGLTILLALSEQILEKTVSQDYDVTYMHGAVTLFAGLIHSFSFEQGTDNDLYRIKIELSKGRQKPAIVVPGGNSGVTLGQSGATPPPNIPAGGGGTSGTSSSVAISPRG